MDGRLLCAGPRGHGAVPLLDEAQRGQCPAQGHAAGDVVGRGAELLGLWPTSSAQSALCPVTAEPEWPRCPPGGGRSAVPPLQGPLRDPRSESPGWECPLPPGVRFPAVFPLQPGEQPPDSGTMQGALRPPRGARLGPGDMRRLPVIPGPGAGSRGGGAPGAAPPSSVPRGFESLVSFLFRGVILRTWCHQRVDGQADTSSLSNWGCWRARRPRRRAEAGRGGDPVFLPETQLFLLSRGKTPRSAQGVRAVLRARPPSPFAPPRPPPRPRF